MTPAFRKSLFRPSATPAHAVALGARSVGHYRVRAKDRENPQVKGFTQIFWSVSGEGTLLFEGKACILGPGTVALYFPGDVHEVQANGPEPWEYRWWTMDGVLSVPIVRSFGFSGGKVYRTKAAPTALFEKLARCIRDITHTGEVRAGAVAFDLLSEAAESARPDEQPTTAPRPPEDFRTAAIALLHQSWQDAGFGVEQQADALGLHRSVFSRRFRAAFGLAPSEYLLRWRVQNALSLLKETELPVHEIAGACGWSDPNYFARCIRKATGLSPSQFRRG